MHVVLIMIRNLSACHKGVLHFSIMSLESLGPHITVSIFEKREFIVIQRKLIFWIVNTKHEKQSDTELVVTLQSRFSLLRRGPDPLRGSALMIDKEGSSKVVLPLLPARGQSG